MRRTRQDITRKATMARDSTNRDAVFGLTGSAAIAGALLMGRIVQLHRRTTFYKKVRDAVLLATVHYEGSLYAIANSGTTGIGAQNALVDRPRIDIPNDAELHCQVTAEVDPGQWRQVKFAIEGSEDVTNFIGGRLLHEPSLQGRISGTLIELEGSWLFVATITVADKEIAAQVTRLLSI
jgi:hypothetical protein